MGRRILCEVNVDIEAVAGNEPARGGQEHSEERIADSRHRKQHAQRVALIQVGKPGSTLAAAETDFGHTLRQAVQAREDFVQITDELDFVKEHLARLLTRRDQAFTSLRIMFGSALGSAGVVIIWFEAFRRHCL